MVGKAKTVYFYSGGEKDAENLIHPWGPRRWQSFLDRVSQNSERNNTVTHYGKEYTAYVRQVAGLRYMYVSVGRFRADWPAVETADHQDPLSVKEYAYLFPIDTRDEIAVVKSSGGPRPGALESLINLVEENALSIGSFVLEPVMRKNAKTRLENSLGVSKLYVRVSTEGHQSPTGGSRIERATDSASEVPGLENADYVIDYTISLKHPKNAGPATDALDREAKELVEVLDPSGKGKIKKLQARLLQPKDGNKISNEPVDFIKDTITVKGEFGDNPNEILSEQQIVDGAYHAIQQFRETMRGQD